MIKIPFKDSIIVIHEVSDSHVMWQWEQYRNADIKRCPILSFYRCFSEKDKEIYNDLCKSIRALRENDIETLTYYRLKY